MKHSRMKKRTGRRIAPVQALMIGALALIGVVTFAGEQRAEELLTEEALTQEALTEESIMPDEKVREKDENLLLQELSSVDLQELRLSLERLYERGCSGIAKIERIREEKGLIYFAITDTDDDLYYLDTNKRGMFGTVLSETGYDNAHMIADTLGIEEGRELLYASEQMEICQCGKITSIEDIERGQAFRFTIVNDRDEKYIIRMGTDGSLGDIRDGNGHDVYAMEE